MINKTLNNKILGVINNFTKSKLRDKILENEDYKELIRFIIIFEKNDSLLKEELLEKNVDGKVLSKIKLISLEKIKNTINVNKIVRLEKCIRGEYYDSIKD